MAVILKSHSITIDEILAGNVPKNIEDYEIQVIEIIKKWYSGEQYMEFTTSGSTGKPKMIRLTKHQMQYSAESTMNYIDPNAEISHSVICISTAFIGGAMLVIRSLLRNLDILVQQPNAIPEIPEGTTSLISMVPYQIMKSLDNDESSFDHIHTMLIGGARLPDKYAETLRRRNINAYITYGMTETASHVALGSIKATRPAYQVIGDTEVSTNENGCLKLRGTVTENNWLQTNDLVKILDKGLFEWTGRADLIINSGGYKINPEPIEDFLTSRIKKPVLILPEEDEILGQKVILLIENENEYFIDNAIFNSLHPYSRPKKVKTVKSFYYTSTGKIDRLATAKKYIK